MATLTTQVYNESGNPYTFDFQYEIEGNTIFVTDPGFNEAFGTGWIDDLVNALHKELMFDFELRIV
jgi:hypothetical protein